MGLAEDLAQPDEPRTVCQVTKVLGGLNAEDTEALEKALVNPDISAAFIGRKLRENGYVVGDEAVRRHRRGACCAGTR